MSKGKGLKYFVGRVREEFGNHGLIGLGTWVISASIRKVLRTNKATWYGLRLNGSVPSPQRATSLSFDLMSIEEATDFFRKNHATFPWMFIEQELEVARASDHLFPCLRDGGEVIGYTKLGIKKVFVLDFERILHIPPTAAFIYDTFIVPSNRGKGLGSLLVARTAQVAQEKGYQSLWCHIPSWNGPSIMAFRRAGFEPVADIRFLGFLGREFFSNRKRPATFHISIDRAPGRPKELRLREALTG